MIKGGLFDSGSSSVDFTFLVDFSGHSRFFIAVTLRRGNKCLWNTRSQSISFSFKFYFRPIIDGADEILHSINKTRWHRGFQARRKKTKFMGSGLPTKPIELSDPLFYFLHGKSLIKSTKRRGLQYEWSMESIGNNPNITCSFASLHFIQLNSSKLLHLVKKSKDFIHLRQNWWTIAWFPDFRIEIIQLVASFLISHFQLILMFVVDWKFINRQTLQFLLETKNITFTFWVIVIYSHTNIDINCNQSEFMRPVKWPTAVY